MLSINKTNNRLSVIVRVVVFVTFISFTSSFIFGITLKDYLFVNNAADNYNEQGFSKNSNNMSAQSSINNYTGSLMYSHRLYEVAGKNGMNITVDLNYNGQVSHLSPNTYQVPSSSGSIPNNANINLPEWIISVNGVAAQVFNFEIEAHNITDDDSPTPIGKATGDNVCTMVDGWHVSQTYNGGDLVQINILSGDGGVNSFKSTIPGGSGNFEYYDCSIGGTVKSYLSGVTGQRTLEVYRGDGTVVTYQEYMFVAKNGWLLGESDVNNQFKPKAFYPVQISDQFGNTITFTYAAPQYGNGAKVLEKVETSWGFVCYFAPNLTYGSYKIYEGTSYSSSDRVYDISFTNNIYLDNGINTHAMIEQIKKKFNGLTEQDTDFEYSTSATREITGFSVPGTGELYRGTWATGKYTANAIEYTIDGISQITYPYGAVEEFSYLGISLNSSIYVPVYNSTNEDAPSLFSVDFKDYGRDPFFNRMVTQMKVLSGSNFLYKDTYAYAKEDDTSIEYGGATTTITRSSTDITLNQGDSQETIYDYDTEIYSLRDILPTSRSFHTMLRSKTVKVENGTADAKKISHNYYTSVSTDPDYYWLKETIETENSISCTTSYEYGFYTDDQNLKQKIETNPLDVRTTTNYLKTYLDNPKGGSDQYINGLVDTIMVDNGIGTDIVAYSDFEYYGSSSSLGYPGQLEEENNYYDISGSYSSVSGTPLTTAYEYYKTSTQGLGNLKQVTDRNGNITFYEYTSGAKTAYEVNASGTQTSVSKTFSEYTSGRLRFPCKITFAYGSDNAISVYEDHDSCGNKLFSIDPNDNLSQYAYDKMNRIDHYILPGDFNETREFTAEYEYDDVAGVGNGFGVTITQKQNSDADLDIVTYSEFDALLRPWKKVVNLSSTTTATATTTYDYKGRVASITDFKNNTTTNEYDDLDRVVKESNPDNTYKTFAYTVLSAVPSYPWTTSADYITKKTTTDEEGHVSIQYVDAIDNLRCSEQFTGTTGVYAKTYFKYNELSNNIEVQNPEGQTITFDYDEVCRLLEIDHPDANTTKYLYDDNGNLKFKQDGNRSNDATYGWTYYKYDELNRLTEEGLSATSPTTEPSSYTSSDIAKSLYSYDDDVSSNSKGRLSFSESPANIDVICSGNSLMKYDYDARGRVSTISQVYNNQKQYEAGTSNVIAISGDAHDVSYEYNSADAITEVTYPNQVSDTHTHTIMAYGPDYADEHGLPELPSDFTEYDESYTMGSNQTITYQLEAGNDLFYYAAIEVDGVQEDYCEDGETSSGSISVNSGDVVTIIVGCTDYPGMDDIDESYSSASLTYVTIENYNISSSYDLRGLLKSVNNIIGTSTSDGFEYDANGNCTDLHYENGIDVTKTYNSRNWITYEDLVSITPSYTFYDNGNLETRTLSPTNTESYSYDGLSRLVSAYYSDSQYTDKVFDYDLNGNRDSYNSTSYYYNSGTNQLKGIGSTSNQFEYDANGNLKYDNRDGLKAMYLYDYKNRMIGVRPERWNQTWNAGTSTPQPGYVCVENGEFSIYSANNVSNTIVEREIPTVSFRDDVPYPDTELSFDFDKVASVDANRFYFYFMNSETGAFLRVHYYRRSHRIDVHQYSTTSGYETIYTNTSYYEDDGNCKFVIVDGDILTFYLDGVLKGATALDNDIDALNAVKILVKEGHFHYDNILVDQIFNTGTTNIVDLDFSDGPYAQFADYYYNTINERILTVKSQEAASYYPFKTNVYDGNGQTLCEYKINKSASYSFLNDYVYGNGKKLARYDGSDIEYYHNNYLGSIQAITDGLGNVVWSRDYYPYGDEKGSGIGSDDANEYKFTGKEWDNESKFFYYWHRYYDPEIGRFVQVDPMWSEYPSMSPYQYTLNNPLRYVDPTGCLVYISDSEEDAKWIADQLNAVLGTDITVKTESKTTFFGKTKTYYRLSTDDSDFDWSEDKYTMALYDAINSTEIIFNFSLVDGNEKHGHSGILYDLGGGVVDKAYKGGANILISNSGTSTNEPMGVVIMHELLSHGHPVGGKNAADLGWYYYMKLSYIPSKLPRKHKGYMSIIGWKEIDLYNKK